MSTPSTSTAIILRPKNGGEGDVSLLSAAKIDPVLKVAMKIQMKDRSSVVSYSFRQAEGLSRKEKETVKNNETGRRIWQASVDLARYLAKNGSLVSGRNVVELGCGVGPIPSLVARHVGAKRVVATDGTGALIPHIRRNLKRNSKTSLSEESTPSIEACRLLWNDATDLKRVRDLFGEEGVSCVVGADVTAFKEYQDDLVATIRYFLEEDEATAEVFRRERRKGSSSKQPGIVVIALRDREHPWEYETFELLRKAGYGISRSVVRKDETPLTYIYVCTKPRQAGCCSGKDSP